MADEEQRRNRTGARDGASALARVRVTRAETIGLVIVVVVILLVVILRWGAHIDWSAR